MVARLVAGAWAAAIVAVMIAAAVSAPVARALTAHGPACPLLTLTGIQCPFCGMTRASVAMGRGDLHGALAHHPLAPVVLLGMLALLVLIAVGRGEWLVRGRRPLLLLGAIGLVWIVRLVYSS